MRPMSRRHGHRPRPHHRRRRRHRSRRPPRTSAPPNSLGRRDKNRPKPSEPTSTARAAGTRPSLTGSQLRPKGGGFQRGRPAVTGRRRLPRRRRLPKTSRPLRTVPQASTSADDAHRHRMPLIRSRRCRHRRPSRPGVAGIRRPPGPSTPASLPRRPPWPPNRLSHRLMRSRSRPSNRPRRADTAAPTMRRPADSRWPTCLRDFRPPRPAAAVAAAATSELGFVDRPVPALQDRNERNFQHSARSTRGFDGDPL